MDTSATQHSAETVADKFADMMNCRNVNALDIFIAKDYIDHNFCIENDREANSDFWKMRFAAFPDTQVPPADGDRVSGRSTHPATFQGLFMRLKPTGRPGEMHSIDIRQVVDGMAVEHWDQVDRHLFFPRLTGESSDQ
ncbi:ester cyclase [Streptomyces sp. NPDC050610]|uniref:ester cyclase n=1 Tax=Streptomyces sp. NPDC050610 TaxID=3157097 RepID=UPI0034291AB4